MKRTMLCTLIMFASVAYPYEVEINGCSITHYYNYDKESYVSFQAYGNVYVETDAKKPVDMYVKVITSDRMATYRVYVTSQPQECGEWNFVKDRAKASFTIRYVEKDEDCTICFVSDKSMAGF